MQEMLEVKRIPLRTSAQPACCHVCGRGLEDGLSITSKVIHGDFVLFCDIHYKMQ